MTLEELIVKDSPNLPAGHPVHYLENVIKREALPKKADHDAEHVDMLLHWNIGDNHDQAGKLTIRNDSEGNPYVDRMWHIALHLRFWKEKGIRSEHVDKFEKETGIDLMTIPLPKAKDDFGSY